ncbi:MAG TPA: hypothetical protein VHD85_01595 [Terracidiphilus sp.]|nr:hypothetical protein [Terracidiphilus sp.]
MSKAVVASLNQETGALLDLLDRALTTKINEPIKFADLRTLNRTVRDAAVAYESRLEIFEDTKREDRL